jgi:hypothetical protein
VLSPARRWLVVALAAVVVVALGITGWALSGALARPGAANTPAETVAVPTGSESEPPTSYECWNQVMVPLLKQCTSPKSRTGLRYVYPSLVAQWDDCIYKAYRATTDTYECTVGKKGVIRYRYWKDSQEASRHYMTRYAKATTARMYLDGNDVGIIYRLDKRVSGVYALSGFWLDNHFSFSVESPTLADRNDLEKLLRLRAFDQTTGRPSGDPLRTGTIS